MLIISKTLLSELSAHGAREYPYECCGAMLGRMSAGEKQVTQLVSLQNESKENKKRRFAVTSEDYMKLAEKAKSAGLSLLGFYRSHPDHPAIPSETDLAYAWPVFSYIIQSVKNGEPGDIFSYTLDLNTDTMTEEKISIEE